MSWTILQKGKISSARNYLTANLSHIIFSSQPLPCGTGGSGGPQPDSLIGSTRTNLMVAVFRCFMPRHHLAISTYFPTTSGLAETASEAMVLLACEKTGPKQFNPILFSACSKYTTLGLSTLRLITKLLTKFFHCTIPMPRRHHVFAYSMHLMIMSLIREAITIMLSFCRVNSWRHTGISGASNRWNPVKPFVYLKTIRPNIRPPGKMQLSKQLNLSNSPNYSPARTLFCFEQTQSKLCANIPNLPTPSFGQSRNMYNLFRYSFSSTAEYHNLSQTVSSPIKYQSHYSDRRIRLFWPF